MRRKWIFVFAFLGMVSAFWATKKAMMPRAQIAPKIEPAEKPYQAGISASGIIEAVGENYSIGAPESGLIQKVIVDVGQKVQKGQELFRLDDRLLQADLLLAEAKESVALAQCEKVSDQLSRLRRVQDSRAISQEEFKSKENEEKIAQATLRQMQIEKERIKTMLERLIVRSPIDGVLLKKNIKEGQYLNLMNSDETPLVVGNITQLQIRANIDEQNASQFVASASASASPKNRPQLSIPLTFVRVDPYVIPKISLTGSSKEKVDTRVLQVIYRFDPPTEMSLYVGQQMDIFIERRIL